MNYKKYIVIGISFFCASHAFGYLPGMNLGFTNILDGGPARPYPGLYWQEYAQYYTTARFKNGEGNSLGGIPSPRFRALTAITQFTYQFNQQLPLKGMPGFSIGFPTVLYSKVDKNPLGIESSGSGVGNLSFGLYTQWSAIQRKGRPFFIHRLQFDLWIPMGKNKLPCKQINPSNTFFSCGSYWAATLFISHKWNVSWRLHYLWNAKNEKIDTQAGDAMYCNYSLGYEAHPHLFIAVVGYALGQLHYNRAFGRPIKNVYLQQARDLLIFIQKI